MSIKTIDIWKTITQTGNTSHLTDIIHEEAIFYSPIVYTPQKGKNKVLKYLHTAVKTFKGNNFQYLNNTYITKSFFFAEFTANINDIEINGVDIIKCDFGLIKEFKVLIRPLKGLEVVWNEMKLNLEKYDHHLS